MTPDLLAQSIIAFAMLWAAMNPRKVGWFLDDLSDGNVERLIRRDEMATEAQAILPLMQPRRVA